MRAALVAASAVCAVALLPASAQAVNFAPPSLVASLEDPVEVGSGDFNGDGAPDLVALSGAGTEADVMLGGPAASFSAPVAYPAGNSGASGIVVADFNGDDDPDIAKAAPVAFNVFLLLGDEAPGGLPPGGGFEAPLVFSTAAASTGIATGDFDGDADLDLVTGDSAANEMDILLNNGNGSLVAGTSVPVSDPLDVVVGEFNGDGDPDFAVSTSGPEVAVMTGTGATAATFTGATSLAAGANQEEIAAAELNGDDDLDLLVANADDDTVSLLFGAAGAGFAPAQNLSSGDLPRGIAVRDFDIDGDPDIAVANYNSNDISIFPGQGTTGFGGRVNFAAGLTPTELLAGEFGGDSRPDLVLPSDGDGEVRLLLGGPRPACARPAADLPDQGRGRSRSPAPSTTSAPAASLTFLAVERELPLTCIIYADLGRVSLTTADAAGAEQTADFYDGDFTMSQVVERKKKKLKNGKVKKGPALTITVLTLYGPPPNCGGAKSSGAVAEAAARRPAPLGQRERALPDQGLAKLRDRSGHDLARHGQLLRYADPRQGGRRQGPRLRPRPHSHRAGRRELPGQRQEAVSARR